MSGFEPTPFEIREERHGRTVHLVPRGELDLASAPELEERALATMRDGTDLVIDLRELEFMDSTGVRTLITTHRAAKEEGAGGLTIVGPPTGNAVSRVIQISGVGTALGLVDAP